MIDWTKPIETVDGRRARLVEANIERLEHIVYTYGGSGDVFIVNPEGVRCDDSAVYSKRQEPFIRNAPVKREGWVVKMKGKDRLWDDHIYSSEENARRNCPSGCMFVYMEWEEKP